MCMADEREPARSMRCRSCGYVLDQLTSNQCPECGEAFDPDDPQTFQWYPKPRSRPAGWKSPGLLIAIYVLPQFTSLLFWMQISARPSVVFRWGGWARWMSLSTGPFAGVAHEDSHAALLIGLWVVIWTGILAALLFTRLRRLPWWAHCLLSLLWFGSGCWAGMMSAYFTV
jgi:hypothetical protein